MCSASLPRKRLHPVIEAVDILLTLEGCLLTGLQVDNHAASPSEDYVMSVVHVAPIAYFSDGVQSPAYICNLVLQQRLVAAIQLDDQELLAQVGDCPRCQTQTLAPVSSLPTP